MALTVTVTLLLPFDWMLYLETLPGVCPGDTAGLLSHTEVQNKHLYPPDLRASEPCGAAASDTGSVSPSARHPASIHPPGNIPWPCCSSGLPSSLDGDGHTGGAARVSG